MKKLKSQAGFAPIFELIVFVLVVAVGILVYLRVQQAKPSASPAVSKTSSSAIIYASKKGSQVTVFQKNLVGTASAKLYSYDLGEDSLGVNTALSPDKTTLAYIKVDGLHLLNLITSKDQQIIKSTPHPEPNDSQESPTWSIPQLNQVPGHGPGVYALGNLAFSADGKFLSFSQGYYEGSSMGFIELASVKYHAISERSGGLAWSPVNNQILLFASPYVEGAPLSLSAPNNFNQLTDLKAKLGNKNREYQLAAFSYDAQRIAAVFYDELGSDDAGVMMLQSDGKLIANIKTNGRKYAPFFNSKSQVEFVLVQNRQSTLMSFKDDGTAAKVADLPQGYSQWSQPTPGRNGELALEALKYSDPNNDGPLISRFFVLDPTSGKQLYQSADEETFIGFK